MRLIVIQMSIQKRREAISHFVRGKQKEQYFQSIRRQIKNAQELQRIQLDRSYLVEFERQIIEASEKGCISFQEIEQRIKNCGITLQATFFSILIQIFLSRQSKTIQDLQSITHIINQMNPNLQIVLSHKKINLQLQHLIEQTIINEQYAFLSLNLTWKIYNFEAKKEQLSWLAQIYTKLVKNLGFSWIVLDFIYAIMKTDGPLPNIQLIKWLIEAQIDREDIGKNIKIMEIICLYLYRSNKDLNQCVSFITLRYCCLQRIFLSFTNSNNSETKSQILELLLVILTSLQDQAVIILLQKYPIQIYDTIIESFDMELNNEQIFNILSSLAIIFELVPQSLSYMNSFGVFNHITRYSESRYLKIRQISELIIEMNNLQSL